MDLKESLDSLRKLSDALPAILALTGPLERAQSIEQLDALIAGQNKEVCRLDAAIMKSRAETLTAEAAAESAKKEADDMAVSIANRAFEKSKPRREEIEKEISYLEQARAESAKDLKDAQKAVEDAKDELITVKASIDSVKADARQALGI